MKNLFFYSLLSLLFLSCTWDGEAANFTGETCPPEGYENAKVIELECAAAEENCHKYNQNLRRCANGYLCTGPVVETATDTSQNEIFACIQCPEGKLACHFDCIDPLTNSQFCGASDCRDKSKSGTQCEDDETCINGHCLLTSCKNPESLCDNILGRYCTNTMTDPHNCGGCGNDCASFVSQSTTSLECLNGKCVNGCADSYFQCGNSGIHCIKADEFKTNPFCCTELDEITNKPINPTNKCDFNEYCSGGSCQESSCKKNKCETETCIEGESTCTKTCDNSDTKCGYQCKNCTQLDGVENASCDNGTCVINACKLGYHAYKENQIIIECRPNIDTACAPNTSDSPIDCTKELANVEKASCQEILGACTILECKPGFCDVNKLPSDGCEASIGSSAQCCTGDKACDERAFRDAVACSLSPEDNNFTCQYKCKEDYASCGESEEKCFSSNWTKFFIGNFCGECKCNDGQRCVLSWGKIQCE